MSRLCMFHPDDLPLERGWVGKIDGDHVVQLAAQTLEAYFTGGGSAREHAVYPLAAVRLVAPVLHPPAVRIFDSQEVFAFANPAAIAGPGASLRRALPGELRALPRLAAVVGAEQEVAGFTILAEWRDPDRAAPKDRDFALGLGPVVVTVDELDPSGVELEVRVDADVVRAGRSDGFDWGRARDLAAEGTMLRPGDLLAGPAHDSASVPPGSQVEVAAAGIGVLRQAVQAG